VRPQHHPSEAVLADYAAGVLADGPSLAVASHLELCACCRKATVLFEAVGGELLEDMAPSQMAPDALASTLARLDQAPPVSKPIARRVGPEGLRLPLALSGRRIGRRRFVAPGFWVAPVKSNSPDGWRTYLLRAPAGGQVFFHGHNGPEYTVILRGAYLDGGRRYLVGDFAECDASDSHRPSADIGEPCICLLSGQGGLRGEGLLHLVKVALGV